MEYIDLIKTSKIKNIGDHVVLYFQFWQGYIDFLNTFYRNHLMLFILNKYEELLPQIHSYLPCTLKHETKEFEYYTSFISGAFWKILCKCVERGGVEKPEEMVRVFQTFFFEMAKTS